MSKTKAPVFINLADVAMHYAHHIRDLPVSRPNEQEIQKRSRLAPSLIQLEVSHRLMQMLMLTDATILPPELFLYDEFDIYLERPICTGMLKLDGVMVRNEQGITFTYAKVRIDDDPFVVPTLLEYGTHRGIISRQPADHHHFGGYSIQHHQHFKGETVDVVCSSLALAAMIVRDNVQLYIRSVDESAVRERVEASRRKNKRKRKLRKKLRPCVVQLLLSRKVYDSTKAKGQALSFSQHAVRGHFRNQACGPKFKERRIKWVRPHWRGPKSMPKRAKAIAVDQFTKPTSDGDVAI